MFRNIYAPNWKVNSGENSLDALLRCSQHHWLYTKLKSWKAKYSKVASEPDTPPPPPPPELKDAPTNLCQPSVMFPEAPLWILMKGHYLFTVTKKEKKNPEDQAFKLTAKGTFLSCNRDSKRAKRAKKN